MGVPGAGLYDPDSVFVSPLDPVKDKFAHSPRVIEEGDKYPDSSGDLYQQVMNRLMKMPSVVIDSMYNQLLRESGSLAEDEGKNMINDSDSYFRSEYESGKDDSQWQLSSQTTHASRLSGYNSDSPIQQVKGNGVSSPPSSEDCWAWNTEDASNVSEVSTLRRIKMYIPGAGLYDPDSVFVSPDDPGKDEVAHSARVIEQDVERGDKSPDSCTDLYQQVMFWLIKQPIDVIESISHKLLPSECSPVEDPTPEIPEQNDGDSCFSSECGQESDIQGRLSPECRAASRVSGYYSDTNSSTVSGHSSMQEIKDNGVSIPSSSEDSWTWNTEDASNGSEVTSHRRPELNMKTGLNEDWMIFVPSGCKDTAQSFYTPQLSVEPQQKGANSCGALEPLKTSASEEHVNDLRITTSGDCRLGLHSTSQLEDFPGTTEFRYYSYGQETQQRYDFLHTSELMRHMANTQNLEQTVDTVLKAYLNKRFSCSQCYYRSDRRANVDQHILSKHSKNKPFKCKSCDYTAVAKNVMREHVKAKHTKKKSFYCQLCSFSTAWKKALDTHLNTAHYKVRSFSCSLCDFKSFSKSTVNNHAKNTHLKKKYVCSQCDYSAKRNHHLRQHILSKHPKNKLFKCASCDYSAIEKKYLRNHIMSKHMLQKPFSCQVCSYSSVWERALDRHINKVHFSCS